MASRRPRHPGAILQSDFLLPHGLSMSAAARQLGLSQQLLNQIVLEENPVTARTALRLGKLFGTSPEFWLDRQRDWDVWHELKAGKRALASIRPVRPRQ